MSEQNQNPAGVPQEPQPQLPPASTPPPSYPPPATQPAANYVPYAPAQTTNIWAVVSLASSVLSWLGLFGIGGIIGIIAGIVARNEIAASRGAQSGDGLALAGIILGSVNVLLSCIGLLCGLAFFALTLGAIPFAMWR
jgi:hypothetical protein